MMGLPLPGLLAIGALVIFGSAARATEPELAVPEPLSIIELRIGRSVYGRYLPQQHLIVTHDFETGRARGVYRVRPGDVLEVRSAPPPPARLPPPPVPVIASTAAQAAELPSPESPDAPAPTAVELLARAQAVTAALDGPLSTAVDHDAVADLNHLAGDLKERRRQTLDAFQELIDAKRVADAAALPDLSGLFTQLGDVVAGRSRHLDELIAVVETFTRYSEVTRQRMEAVDRRFAPKDQEARHGLPGALAAAAARHAGE